MVFEDVDDSTLLVQGGDRHGYLANSLQPEPLSPDPVELISRPASRLRALESVQHPARVDVGGEPHANAVCLHDCGPDVVGHQTRSW